MSVLVRKILASFRAALARATSRKPRKGAKKRRGARVQDRSKAHDMLSGAGSVFDLAGTGMPPVKLGSVSSDLRKLAEDFRVVGDDWRKVLGSPEPRRHR